VAPTVEVEPTVQALLAYLRERDQQRDREVGALRAELARARADLVDHAAQLAEAREQLRALPAPPPDVPSDAPGRDSGGPTPAPVQESATRPRRRWWRFW
jgi:outer membrane protein TolC